MATHHAKPGEIVDLDAWADDLPVEKTKAIVKADQFEMARLVLKAGKAMPKHKVNGPITVQCIQGKIAFNAMGKSQELKRGQLVYLRPEEPHALKAIEDSVILLTIVFL